MAIIFGHFQFCFEAKTQALLKMKIPLMPKLCWRLCQMNECDEYDAEDCGGRNSLSIVKVCTASTALQILTPPFCGGGSSVVTLQKTDIILSAILHTRLRCGWRLTEDKQTADSMRTFCQSRIHPLKGKIHPPQRGPQGVRVAFEWGGSVSTWSYWVFSQFHPNVQCPQTTGWGRFQDNMDQYSGSCSFYRKMDFEEKRRERSITGRNGSVPLYKM